MESNDPEAVSKQIAELTSRIWRIEQALRRRGVVLDEAAAAQAAPAASATPAQPVQTPPPVHEQVPPTSPASVPIPSFGYSAQDSAPPDRTLESRIGSQWFNRIGILAVLIGMAWFLKFAIDNHWIGPLGRVLIGLAAGAALNLWSEQFRSRGYAVFSYSLKAIGSGILYLSLWAAFSIYHLLPGSVAFAAMIAVTAFNGFMAWSQDAELLALYAIAGGISTPILVSTGGNHEVALFNYLLILDFSVLLLVVLKPWSRLLSAAFAGTVFMTLGWSSEYYYHSELTRTALYAAGFFLLFALGPRLVRIDLAEGETPGGWDALAIAVLPAANAALGFFVFYQLFDEPSTSWVAPWLAVLFAGFYLLLLRLPQGGRIKASPPLLSALHLATAVVFLTLAIPLKTHGRWLTIGWLVEGAALMWVAHRTGARLLHFLSLACLALGLFALFAVNPLTTTTPIFNARFGTYIVAIAAFAFVAWLAYTAPAEDEAAEHSFTMPAVAAMAVLIANALILVAVAWEIHSFWWSLEWKGDYTRFGELRMAAQFTYSAWFMLFGAILLTLGFYRRSSFLRWQALVLLALSVGKVFLVDVSELSQGLRILSFLGLGALLLGVSFVYQRDWLNLRGSQRRNP